MNETTGSGSEIPPNGDTRKKEKKSVFLLHIFE